MLAEPEVVVIDAQLFHRYVTAASTLIADLLEHGPGEQTVAAELLYIAATTDLRRDLLGAHQ